MHRNFNLPVGGCERSDVPHPDSIVHRVRQDMVTIRTKGQSWGECHNLQLLRSVYRCMVYPLKSPHYIMWQRMWQRVWQRMWQRMWQRVWLTCDGIDVALHLSVNFATLQIPHFNTVVNTTGDNVIWLLIETHGRHLHIIEGLLITFAVINRGGGSHSSKSMSSRGGTAPGGTASGGQAPGSPAPGSQAPGGPASGGTASYITAISGTLVLLYYVKLGECWNRFKVRKIKYLGKKSNLADLVGFGCVGECLYTITSSAVP